MNQQIFNPWAPPVLNGFHVTSPDNCHDVDHAFVFPETYGFQPMTANQQISYDIVLDDNADFRLNALQWTLEGLDESSQVPGFLYRIKDGDGQFIHEGFVYCYATPGSFANPWPIFPGVTYTAGQRIQFDLINLNDDLQGVQLVFRGYKRFVRIA